jgi:hypothetical protein
MNQWMWGFALVLGLLLLWAVFRLGAAERVPEPRYRRVALLDKGVEIREYPALAIAKTPMRDASLGSSANEGFRRVARYLFGGNRSKESMAMTAPVVMEMGDTPALYFYMPFDQMQASRTLAVLAFGGFAGNKELRKQRRRLEAVLKKEGWIIQGPFLYMGYNAPWTLVGRRNEVAFEVRRSNP